MLMNNKRGDQTLLRSNKQSVPVLPWLDIMTCYFLGLSYAFFRHGPYTCSPQVGSAYFFTDTIDGMTACYRMCPLHYAVIVTHKTPLHFSPFTPSWDNKVVSLAITMFVTFLGDLLAWHASVGKWLDEWNTAVWSGNWAKLHTAHLLCIV